MEQRSLRFISAGFMGITLFIAFYLVDSFPSYSYYFIELFIVLNMIKDIILYKKGLVYDKIGIKEMTVAYIIILILFIMYHIYNINNQGTIIIY